MKNQIKGQITILMSLVMCIMISLFLTVIETARGSALKIQMECAVDTALHSVFAEYNSALEERYHLFFIDSSYQTQLPDYLKIEERLDKYLNYDLKPTQDLHLTFIRDWFDITQHQVVIKHATLASDDGGNVFKKEAVRYFKDKVSLDAIQDVQSWIATTEEYQIDPNQYYQEQKKVTNEVKEFIEGSETMENRWSVTKIYPEIDIPRFYLNPILTLYVTGGLDHISEETLGLCNSISFRRINQGSGPLFEEENIVSVIGRERINQSVIVGGVNGISLIRSSVLEDNDCIDLIVMYRVEPWCNFGGIFKMKMLNRCRIRAWTGYKKETNNLQTEQKVFVAETGNVYHTNPGCTHLFLSISGVSPSSISEMRNKYGEKYYRCEVCWDNDKEADSADSLAESMMDRIYITSQGNRYHRVISCTGLKRTIIEIPISKTGNRTMCRRCASARENGRIEKGD